MILYKVENKVALQCSAILCTLYVWANELVIYKL